MLASETCTRCCLATSNDTSLGLDQGRIFAFRGHAKDVQATQAPEIAEIFRSKGDLGLALRNQRHGQRNWTLVTQGSVLLVSDCV
jgi:hypothetical protein